VLDICITFKKRNIMSTLLRLLIIVLVHVFTSQIQSQEGYNISVKVNGLSSNEGKVFLAIYDTEEDFLENTFKGTTSSITNQTCEVIFENIPKGIYAISIFHDENDNGKMDTNFMGIPKEDYGCSNNASGFMGPPKWKDAKFELTNDTTITINL
jgi:uncharacterized protein (DUF2141 family)